MRITCEVFFAYIFASKPPPDILSLCRWSNNLTLIYEPYIIKALRATMLSSKLRRRLATIWSYNFLKGGINDSNSFTLTLLCPTAFVFLTIVGPNISACTFCFRFYLCTREGVHLYILVTDAFLLLARFLELVIISGFFGSWHTFALFVALGVYYVWSIHYTKSGNEAPFPCRILMSL